MAGKRKSSAATSPAKPKKQTTTSAGNKSGGGVVSIEACKSWGVFGRSTKKLSEEIHAENPGVKIEVNAAGKPGRGNFVVTVSGKEIVGLRALPRPFKALRELDLVEAAQRVLVALK